MSSNPVKFNLKKPSPAATTAPGDGPITLKRKAETEAPQGDTPGGVEPIQAKKPRESEGVKIKLGGRAAGSAPLVQPPAPPISIPPPIKVPAPGSGSVTLRLASPVVTSPPAEGGGASVLTGLAAKVALPTRATLPPAGTEGAVPRIRLKPDAPPLPPTGGPMKPGWGRKKGPPMPPPTEAAAQGGGMAMDVSRPLPPPPSPAKAPPPPPVTSPRQPSTRMRRRVKLDEDEDEDEEEGSDKGAPKVGKITLSMPKPPEGRPAKRESKKKASKATAEPVAMEVDGQGKGEQAGEGDAAKVQGQEPPPAPQQDMVAIGGETARKETRAFLAKKPVGIEAGKLEIRKGLRDGFKYLQKFQAEQGLEVVPTATPALHMLDMLGLSRPEVYKHVFEDMLQQLERRIDNCGNESQLERLLGAAFQLISLPELRCVVERVLSKFKAIPPRFLEKLVKKPQLLESLPLAIKQQAWEADVGLFRAHIANFIKQYVHNRTCVLLPAFDVSHAQAVNKVNTHKRREEQKPVLDAIVQCINNKLEPCAYQYLTQLMHHTGDGAYCTLVGDLNILLAPARSGKANILSRLTLLARCLDECVREGGIMESKSLIQVQNHFRQVVKMCDERCRRNGQMQHSKVSKGSVDLSKVPSLEKAIRDSIAHMLRMDKEKSFQKAVVEAWPDVKEDYLRVVKHPMDLSLMRRRQESGYYKTFAAFDHDAQLIYKNCMTFNPVSHGFHTMAKSQLQAWNSFKTRYKDVDLKVSIDGASKGKGSRGAKTEVDEAPKDPTVIKPLMGREGIEGTPFGHALAILADPFVVQLLCRTIARKLDEVAKGQTLPKDHPMIPSLLQLLCMAISARHAYDASSHDKDFCIPSAEDAEGAVGFMLRHLMPCYLELAGFNKLMNKYGVSGWDNQPHEKEEIQDRRRVCMERLYRMCKKQGLSGHGPTARAPPLVLRFLQQALVDSVALVEDSRSENVVEMLKRLYQHCRKKDASGEAHYRPDPHDRFLWASLATAAIHRSQSRVPLEKDLRDRLLDLYGQELPHTKAMPLTSWLHEHFIRLVREWASKGVLKPADVTHHLTTKVLEQVGPLRRVWDEPRFAPHRAEYEKLFDAQEGLRDVMMGPEQDEEDVDKPTAAAEATAAEATAPEAMKVEGDKEEA